MATDGIGDGDELINAPSAASKARTILANC